ncbi:stage V sporulation protein B [Mycoplasmatota bacterium]|nr:stage V sporulation protein B [Mycoplasmatota bacterium]
MCVNNTSFYKKSSLLILVNLTTGLLSFLFSVILSRKIGAEGMGLYSLVLPISSLLLSIISGGLLVAVSKVVAEYHAKKEMNNLHKCIKITIIFNLIFSFIIIFFAYLLSYQISIYIVKDSRTVYALRFIFISIICMTLSNTYKGYFYGRTNVVVPAFIDIIEKATRIILLLFLFKLRVISTITESITTAYLVFFIGEFVSLILLYIYYQLDQKEKPQKKEKTEDFIQLLYNIFSISLPLMMTELISSSLFTISSLLLPRRLLKAGFPYNEALSLIGRFISMSMQIVFFPMIIIYSISAILIPDLSSNISKQDFYTVEKRASQVIKISFILGIFVCMVCLLFGDGLGRMVFKRNDLGNYIRFIAFSAPFIYSGQTARGILNGLGKQKVILKYSIVISFLQVILLYFLVAIPSINIYGFGITLISTTFISLFIYIKEIKKVIHLKL